MSGLKPSIIIILFDSLNRTTWSRSGNKFDFAILYPIDSAMRGNINDILEDLTKYKDIGKLFLVSWTDNRIYDYANILKYYV